MKGPKKTISRKRRILVAVFRCLCKNVFRCGWVLHWKCVLVRFMFCIHCLLTAWRVTVTKQDSVYWLMGMMTILIVIEGVLSKRIEKMFKTSGINICLLIYLVSVVPSVWLIELARHDKTLNRNNLTELPLLTETIETGNSNGRREDTSSIPSLARQRRNIMSTNRTALRPNTSTITVDVAGDLTSDSEINSTEIRSWNKTSRFLPKTLSTYSSSPVESNVTAHPKTTKTLVTKQVSSLSSEKYSVASNTTVSSLLAVNVSHRVTPAETIGHSRRQSTTPGSLLLTHSTGNTSEAFAVSTPKEEFISAPGETELNSTAPSSKDRGGDDVMTSGVTKSSLSLEKASVPQTTRSLVSNSTTIPTMNYTTSLSYSDTPPPTSTQSTDRTFTYVASSTKSSSTSQKQSTQFTMLPATSPQKPTTRISSSTPTPFITRMTTSSQQQTTPTIRGNVGVADGEAVEDMKNKIEEEIASEIEEEIASEIEEEMEEEERELEAEATTSMYEGSSETIVENIVYLDDVNEHITDDDEKWILALQTAMILVLIVSRWIQSRRNMTRLRLSEILRDFIIYGMDIMEFFSLFDIEEVTHSSILTQVVLATWSLSLVRFVIIFGNESKLDYLNKRSTLCDRISAAVADTAEILSGLLLQDKPFLVVRCFVVFHYSRYSTSLLFFLGKNLMMVLIYIYRLAIKFWPGMENEPEIEETFPSPDKKDSSSDIELDSFYEENKGAKRESKRKSTSKTGDKQTKRTKYEVEESVYGQSDIDDEMSPNDGTDGFQYRKKKSKRKSKSHNSEVVIETVYKGCSSYEISRNDPSEIKKTNVEEGGQTVECIPETNYVAEKYTIEEKSQTVYLCDSMLCGPFRKNIKIRRSVVMHI